VAGNGLYTQGAMQTVQQSASGIDPRTGRTITGTTAGVIHGKYLSIIAQRLRNHQRGPEEALLPIYNAQGQIAAYERHMAPKALAALQRNTHMGEMLGAWAGRQAEEELGREYNHKLVDNLKAIWDRDKAKRADEFVDLSDDKLTDPIYLDSWKMVPGDLRAYIEEVFGDEGFMIRRDMINNAVGYRAASITDPWTGISRMGDKHQEGFVKVATALLGQDAFTKLATAEKAIQAGVSVVKSTIVVRSIIIPMANLASNFLQLSLHGVGVRDMVSGYQTKLVEIVKYQKNLKRAIDIKAEITAQRGNHDAVRRLETELKSLEDSNRRMSIWPLIDAGEFATISEGLTEADAALSQGKWAQYIQGVMDKIPAKAGTIGRYAFITRDTALFQGMARAMQYGDFLAKSVLHDHLVKQGKTKTEALKGVTEEFVNYNLLPGRTRSYADSMGLSWFWAFKLRSIKIARQHIINHPFRALMLSIGNPMMPEIPGMTLGSPIEDNMLSVVADGRLGYSIGPGMAFNAPSLHPWVNGRSNLTKGSKEVGSREGREPDVHHHCQTDDLRGGLEEAEGAALRHLGKLGDQQAHLKEFALTTPRPRLPEGGLLLLQARDIFDKRQDPQLSQSLCFSGGALVAQPFGGIGPVALPPGGHLRGAMRPDLGAAVDGVEHPGDREDTAVGLLQLGDVRHRTRHKGHERTVALARGTVTLNATVCEFELTDAHRILRTGRRAETCQSRHRCETQSTHCDLSPPTLPESEQVPEGCDHGNRLPLISINLPKGRLLAQPSVAWTLPRPNASLWFADRPVSCRDER
jgi:hypothetical protein